jgi:hypothetical protein
VINGDVSVKEHRALDEAQAEDLGMEIHVFLGAADGKSDVVRADYVVHL